MALCLGFKNKNYDTDFKKIISELQSFLSNSERYLEKYRQNPTDFTRERKLPFKTVSKLLSKLLKKAHKQNSTIFLKTDKLVQNQLSAKPEKS